MRNTLPAESSLLVLTNAISWLRAGAAAEVSQVVFESSTDGLDWRLLGTGARVAGGWELAGQSAAPGESVRARGLATGGLGNGSRWWIETVSHPAPRLSLSRLDGPVLRLQIEGQAGLRATLESTPPEGGGAGWSPVWTFDLGIAPVQMLWTNTGEPRRLFRVRGE